MKQCEGCGYNMSCTDRVDEKMGELHEECAVADDMTPEQTEACNQGQCPCWRAVVTEDDPWGDEEDVGAVVMDTDNNESLRFDAVKGGLQIEYCYSEWVTGTVYEDRTETHVCRSRDGIEALRDTCRTLANTGVGEGEWAVLMDCDDTLMLLHVLGDWYCLRVYAKERDEAHRDIVRLKAISSIEEDWDGICVDIDDYPIREFLDDLADECDELLGRETN